MTEIVKKRPYAGLNLAFQKMLGTKSCQSYDNSNY